jgi:O-antigen ligase
VELVIPALAALAVFAFAAGSSSVTSVVRVGHDARWALLGLLLVAAGYRVIATRRLVLAPAPTAAAAALVVLALVSSAWSISPRLSVERSVSLGVLFATAVLLAAGEREPRRLLAGLVAGAVAVAVAGLVVLAGDHSAAVQAASLESPARYRGLGQDPNTAALLFGIAIAPALALARRRPAWFAAVALFAGSIVASGSRGGLFAGGVGALVVVSATARPSRRTILTAAAVVAAVAVGLVVENVPKAHASAGAPTPAAVPGPAPARGYLNAEAVYPLAADIGGPLPGGGQPPLTRGFFGGSGRVAAWTGTIHQILQRPLLGFGFGTEEKVFVDRYYYFVGGTPEDSYLGISLQLGIVGLVILLALFVAFAADVRRALRRDVCAACAGAVAAGLTLAVVQSYVYSAGNIGSATLWICAFLLPVAARA